MNSIGQTNFLNKFKSTYNRNNIPHSAIILGDSGSGHVDVCKDIAEYYDLMLYDITELITNEYIEQIYLCSNPSMYVVDLARITEKEQNIILKLFEEPNPLTYIYLFGENTYNVIETVLNRGKIFNLDKYSRDYLSSIVTDKNNLDLILNLCRTPGQIEIANHTDINSLKKLCDTMINKISSANFQNTLTISNKINFKDEYGKYDWSLFMKMLGLSIKNNNAFKIYEILNESAKIMPYMNDKKSYFENFLIRIWKASRL